MTESILHVSSLKKTFIVLKAKQICISHLSMHLELLGSNQFNFVFRWNTIVSIISSNCGVLHDKFKCWLQIKRDKNGFALNLWFSWHQCPETRVITMQTLFVCNCVIHKQALELHMPTLCASAATTHEGRHTTEMIS